MSGPAAAVLDDYPDDPAEAGASVLMSSLMEQELLGAAESVAGFPTDPGPNEAGLDVDLLGGQLLSLGDIEIPIDQFADFGQLGALSSISEASSPMDGHAASGLLGPDGGLSLDSAEADWGTTTIDLLSVSDALGLGGLTDLAVDQLDLELGAMGSEVIAENGVFLDPDGGVTGPGQYIAGDASLYLHSPLIEDAAAQVSDLGGQVDTAIEGIVNDTLDIGAIAAALPVPGLPAPECTVDSNMQGNIVDAVVGQPLTSANQLVTIDFSTGTAEIHLEHLVEGNDPWGGGDDAGLNGLAPNTELISAETYPQIAEGVHEIIEEAIQIMTTAVQESLESVTITCSWYQEGPLPGDVIDVTWGPINLADAAAGNFPPVETNCTGPTATIACETLATTIDTAGPLLAPIFGSVYDYVISDEGAAIYELLINDIKTGLITETIGSALQPVFDALVPFISLQVNHQETETCTTPSGDEALSSLEVSALSLMLGGGDFGRIGLGNSGVRVDACALALTPTISVDPVEFPAGECTVVTGEGYTPNATVTVQLTDADGNPVGDPIPAETDDTGAFTVDLCTTPDTPPGDYTVVGTDDTTGTPAETPATVLEPSALLPMIEADPAEVFPGDETTITGTGYTPDSTATVQLVDTDGNPVGDPVVVNTDETGAFVLPAVIQGDTVPGDYTVVGTDDTTGTPAEAPLTVLDPNAAPVPTITADPAEVPAGGATTTVTGEGFTPEGMVTLYLQDADGDVLGEPEPFPAQADGTFEMVLNVPDDAPVGDDYTIVAIDEETGQEATTPFAITDGADQCTDPTLMAPTEPIMPGSEVTVTGTGFPAGVEVAVQLTNPEGEPVGDPVMVTPDESCGFEVTIMVPEDADPGLWVIIGTPEDGSEGAEVPIAVCGPDGPRSLDAWFEFGTVEQGDQQTFFASGFEPGEMVTAVIYSTSIALPAEPANADGMVSWTFTVPSDFHTGKHVGVATSTVHGDHALSDFQVTAGDGSSDGSDDCDCADDGNGSGDGNGDDNGSGNGSGNDGSDDRLAATGSDAGVLAALSFLLLGAGAVLIRRRQILSRRSLA